jgi:hypothetical protein
MLAFRSTAPADSRRVRAFLRQIFNVDDNAPFLDSAQITWKYYDTHPMWEGSRSFVYEDDRGIAAHICAWPVRLLTMAGPITGVDPIDWAASPGVPGIGAQILRQMSAVSDVICCVGGTGIARSVIARSGHRPFADLAVYARPLRALRQALTHHRRDWTLPARLARNLAWTMQARVPAAPGWSAEPVEPGELPDTVLPAPQPGLAVAARSHGLFRYLLQCPAVRHQLFIVEHGQEPVGYFLLSFPPGQARICDAFTGEHTPAAWARLYGLAIRSALREGSAAEIIAASSFEPSREALLACGFRRAETIPVMLSDAGNRLSAIRSVHVQMIDSDLSFLHDDRPEYRT